VFFNVDLLRMNRDIAVTSERARTVQLENARLRTDIARLGSSERIQRVAADRGLVLPAPGEVRYLRSDPSSDSRRAAARMREDEAGPAAASPARGGSLAAPNGSPAVPAAQGTAPAGQGTAPQGTPPAGQVTAPAGQVTAPVAPGVQPQG
jgi:hypothetical protein